MGTTYTDKSGATREAMGVDFYDPITGLPVDFSQPATVGGLTTNAPASFSRPADANQYAIGDLVANNTVAGNVTPMQFTAARVAAGTGQIRRARLSTNKTGLVGTEAFRLHLFKLAPVVAVGDNAPFIASGVMQVNGIGAIKIGTFDLTLSEVFTDGAKGFAAPNVGSEISFDAAAGSQLIYGLLEARSAYVPASGETFTAALEILRD